MQKPSLLFLAFLLSVSFLLSSNAAFSQASNKPIGNVFTEVTSTPAPDPQVSEAISNLNTARNNGDMTSQRFWETKLHELTHPQIISENCGPLVGKTVNVNVSDPSKVLNVTTVEAGTVIANSVSRERVTGNIYAATGVYGVAGSDTLKVYRSIDNGLHFTLIYTLTSPLLFKINFNQLDVEAVSRGDSTFAFIGMSYTVTGTYYSIVVRVRQDGGQVGLLGYAGNATNKYYGGRITSDNARYTSNAYIYFSTVLDSTNAGARSFRSKFSRIENPFGGTMVLTSGYSSTFGLYGYGTLSPTPDSAFFQTDLAFVSTSPGDSVQLYTCTIVRGHASFNGANLYFTRSNDFGATAPTLFNIADGTNLKENPRIAATGLHNSSLMVATRRLFGGGDWDAYYFYTPSINAPVPSFASNGYVDSSTDTTYGVSLVAKYGGNGSYLFAYNNLFHGISNGNIFIKGANNTTFGFAVQANPPTTLGANFYGLPDAAFRNVNNDSCMVMWSGGNGVGSYVTGGCTGAFVGIGNNTTELRDFRLDQNYPNPFNPTTNISYNIPVSGLVKIVVYDVLGSEVATILNENKVAGYYSATFDGKNLASGAYYYKITFTSDNNSFSQTKKMMLIK